MANILREGARALIEDGMELDENFDIGVGLKQIFSQTIRFLEKYLKAVETFDPNGIIKSNSQNLAYLFSHLQGAVQEFISAIYLIEVYSKQLKKNTLDEDSELHNILYTPNGKRRYNTRLVIKPQHKLRTGSECDSDFAVYVENPYGDVYFQDFSVKSQKSIETFDAAMDFAKHLSNIIKGDKVSFSDFLRYNLITCTQRQSSSFFDEVSGDTCVSRESNMEGWTGPDFNTKVKNEGEYTVVLSDGTNVWMKFSGDRNSKVWNVDVKIWEKGSTTSQFEDGTSYNTEYRWVSTTTESWDNGKDYWAVASMGMLLFNTIATTSGIKNLKYKPGGSEHATFRKEFLNPANLKQWGDQIYGEMLYLDELTRMYKDEKNLDDFLENLDHIGVARPANPLKVSEVFKELISEFGPTIERPVTTGRPLGSDAIGPILFNPDSKNDGNDEIRSLLYNMQRNNLDPSILNKMDHPSQNTINDWVDQGIIVPVSNFEAVKLIALHEVQCPYSKDSDIYHWWQKMFRASVFFDSQTNTFYRILYNLELWESYPE